MKSTHSSEKASRRLAPKRGALVLGMMVILGIVSAGLWGRKAAMSENPYTFDFGTGRSAIHALEIDLPGPALEPFIARLKKFGIRNGFKRAIRRFTDESEGIDFVLADYWREDVALSGSNRKLNFGFYIYIDPNKGGTPERASELMEELTQFAAEFPGATVKKKW